MAILDVILALAAFNNLSHIVYFNNDELILGPAMNVVIPVSGVSCAEVTRNRPQWSRYFTYNMRPVVNVVINCPVPAETSDKHGPGSRGHGPRSRGHGPHSRGHGPGKLTDVLPDPLAHPLLNLIVVGPPGSPSQYYCPYIRWWGMMQTVLRIEGQQTDSKTLRSVIYESDCSSLQNETLVGVIDDQGRYTSIGSRALISDDFKGFAGRNFRVACVNGYHCFQQIMTTKKHVVEGRATWSGVFIEVLDAIAAIYNFTYDIVENVEHVYGAKDENGSWVGLVGMLHRKEVDLIVADLTITSHREKVVDFTYPYWHTSIAVFFGVYSDDWFYVFRPFHEYVWVVFLASLALCAATFYCFNRILRVQPNSAPDWILVCVGVLFSQSCERRVFERQSSRFVAGSMWFSVLAVLAAYTGNLVATLATHKTHLPFSTVEELLQDNTYKLGVNYGNVGYLVLKEAKGGILARMYQSLDLDTDRKTAMHLLFETKAPLAYIGDKLSETNNFRDNGFCEWQILPETFYPSNLAAALPENSPFVPFFSNKIMQFHENGLLGQWGTRHRPVDICGSREEMRRRLWSASVTMQHIRGLLITFSVGLVAALILLLLEVIKHVSERQSGNIYR